MSSNNWEKLGEEIRRTVQDAVETQNYEKLSQVIGDTINQAVDTVADSVKKASISTKTQYKGYKTYTTDEQRAKKSSGMQYTNATQETRLSKGTFEVKLPSKVGAILPAVLGFSFGAIQLFVFIVLLATTLIFDSTFGLGPRLISGTFSAFSLVMSALGFGVGTYGAKKLGRIDRLKNYIAAIGKREYCNISELAAKVGKSDKAVIKDLEYMIKNRWFGQGHLDKQKTCLMVTDKMYDQYCQLEQRKAIEQKEAEQKEALQKEAERKAWEEQNASRQHLSPEVQKVIMQGEEYVRKIRKCNDDIPGEEISAKIYRIEMLVDKIFDRVEQNPKCVSDIKKLMDYYLPTTVKLLEAYAEMDAQPAGGENIQSAKKEIEATLDTLNAAFEKLLDDLFQETAWDVSSDISVLNTMLAQEGLKEDGLKRK